MDKSNKRLLVGYLLAFVGAIALVFEFLALQALAADRAIAIPAGSPQTPATEALGHDVFADPILSIDNTKSCASCHSAKHGLSDEGPVSVGIRNQLGTRRSPTALNVAFLPQDKPSMFWDAHATGLEGQVAGPIVNPVELGNQPLTCEVRGGRLVISIGVGVLAMMTNDDARLRAKDGKDFPFHVCRIIADERGLNKLIDDAART